MESVVQCNRGGVAWLLKGIWKIRGLRYVTEGRTHPLCQGKVNAIHIAQTRGWKENFLAKEYN
jgi:hypothetical protein